MNPFISAPHDLRKLKFDTALNEVMATNPAPGFVYNGANPVAIASIEKFKEAIWVKMYAGGFMGKVSNASDKTEWFWYQGNNTPRTVYGSVGLYYNLKHKPNYFNKDQKNNDGWFSNTIITYANQTAEAKWLEYYKKYPIIKKWEDDANASYKPPAPTPLPNENPVITAAPNAGAAATTTAGMGTLGWVLIGGMAVTALVVIFWPSGKPNSDQKKVSQKLKHKTLK